MTEGSQSDRRVSGSASTPDEKRSALVAEVLGGGNRDLQLMAARGVLPLAVSELVSVQVALCASLDEEIARTAEESLVALDAEIAARVVGEGVGDEVVAHLAFHLPHPQVLEEVLRLRGVSHDLLIELAPRLSPDLQEILLLRQDSIIETPAILEALDLNPSLSAYSRRRILEYREHLLPRSKRQKTSVEVEEEAESLSEEQIGEAIEVAAKAPAEGQVDDLTGLSESQIRSLAVPVRLALSRGASRTLRNVLVRDTNPQVATSVLKHNPLTESEVEEIAENRAVRGEVLAAISNNRAWMRRYPIMAALVRNPRCPAGLAVRMVPRLSVRDLMNLQRDRGVSHNVRSAATRLYRIKRL